MPVTPTEAFVGFTAQMGEWWDPMLSPDAADLHRHRDRPRRRRWRWSTATSTYAWGRVIEWDPIGRYSQDFWLGHAEEAPTVLEVTFTEATPAARSCASSTAAGRRAARRSARSTPTGSGLLERYAAHVS